MIEFDVHERRSRLARRHHLATAGKDVTTVARVMSGLHSTDPASVYLSARARVDGFEIPHLENALYEERSLARVLGMRRTLFVVPSEMEVDLRRGCASKYGATERRRLVDLLADQHGCDSAWLADVTARTLEALRDLGEATANELTELVPELSIKLSFGEGKRWGGHFGLSTRVLFLLATDGEIIRARPRGSWVSGQYRWALRETWLGPAADKDPSEARVSLARHWLTGFGPGSYEDLKWWTGWGARETRVALDGIDTATVSVAGAEMLVMADDIDRSAEVDPWAALLPALDPTPMGWRDRSWFLGEHRTDLFDRSGNIGPSVWVNGRIVGGWAQHVDGNVAYELLEPVSRDEQALIAAEAENLQNWLAGNIVTPRFRTPVEQRLQKQAG